MEWHNKEFWQFEKRRKNDPFEDEIGNGFCAFEECENRTYHFSLKKILNYLKAHPFLIFEIEFC